MAMFKFEIPSPRSLCFVAFKVVLVNCKGNLTKYSRWERRLGGNLEVELYCNFLSWYGNQSSDVDSLNFEPSISQIWSKFTRFQ